MAPHLHPNTASYMDLDNLILTHGYVHGHVHQHEDHMHIHGHIHNHDHLEPRRKSRRIERKAATGTAGTTTIDTSLPVVSTSSNSTTNSVSTTNSTNETDIKSDTLKALDGAKPTTQSSGNILTCTELDALDVCSDIFCEELDDCYFYDCERLQGLEPCEDEECEAECCHDPTCADTGCEDTDCGHDHHDNSLCELQKPRMPIFEDIIHNVQKNIEGLGESRGQGKNPAEMPVLIHFPHHCHLDDPVVSSHLTHQSCFHAKVPNVSSSDQPSDFDFFAQFNNFDQWMSDVGMDGKLKAVKAEKDDNKPTLSIKDHLKTEIKPDLTMPMEKPDTVAPSALNYPCKWEKCHLQVDDNSLASHVIDSHLRHEYDLNNSTLPFECEWDTCNYVDSDLADFVRHLDTHKSDAPKFPSPLTPVSLVPESDTLASLTALSTLASLTTSQPLSYSQFPNSLQNDLHITSMTISPKVQDTNFTCRWQIGTTPTGEPIMCNRTHSSEGELQHHLQDEHIGLGKSEYSCCWVGCARNGGKVFVQRQKLLRHIHVHTHYKPCVCKVCGARFAVPAMLNQHMRTHSGEKPFECQVCGKRFTTSLSLSIHHRVHSGERPLECKWPGCGKRFSESSNLAKHMRVHTKKFSCEVCGEVFDKKTLYTKHKRTHATQ